MKKTVQYPTVAWLNWVFDLGRSVSDYTYTEQNDFSLTLTEETIVMATCTRVTNPRLSLDRNDL